VARSLIDSGETEKAATIGCRGFLSAIRRDRPHAEETASIVDAFLVHLKSHMRATRIPDDWVHWREFLRENESLTTTADLSNWSHRAASFCSSEIDAITQDAGTSSEAQDRYDGVELVAKSWSLSLDSKQSEVSERLDELIRREEALTDTDDDELAPDSGNPMSGDDPVIDRLFASLTERACETDCSVDKGG
jgi:hypothetical protein